MEPRRDAVNIFARPFLLGDFHDLEAHLPYTQIIFASASQFRETGLGQVNFSKILLGSRGIVVHFIVTRNSVALPLVGVS